MTTTEAQRLATQAMDRVRRAYAERTPLPERDDNCDDLVAAEIWDARTLTLNQLQRLYKAILGEHGL